MPIFTHEIPQCVSYMLLYARTMNDAERKLPLSLLRSSQFHSVLGDSRIASNSLMIILYREVARSQYGRRSDTAHENVTRFLSVAAKVLSLSFWGLDYYITRLNMLTLCFFKKTHRRFFSQALVSTVYWPVLLGTDNTSRLNFSSICDRTAAQFSLIVRQYCFAWSFSNSFVYRNSGAGETRYERPKDITYF